MKALVIGGGSIGSRHALILGQNALVDEVAVVTRRSLPDVNVYQNLEEVPSLDEYGYFVVASETGKHLEHFLFLEERVSGKTILIEKPVFSSHEVVKSASNRVYVGYNLRFHPALEDLKEIIDRERPLFVNVVTGQYLPDWRPDADYRKTYSASMARGGGVLLDLSHEIDYLQWLFGSMTEIHAIQDKISDLEIETDDIVTAVGTTDRGVVFNFTIDYINKIPVRRILVHTSASSVEVDLVNHSLRARSRSGDPDIRESYDVDRDDTYLSMHRAILSGDEGKACDLSSALSTMSIVDEIRARSYSGSKRP